MLRRYPRHCHWRGHPRSNFKCARQGRSERRTHGQIEAPGSIVSRSLYMPHVLLDGLTSSLGPNQIPAFFVDHLRSACPGADRNGAAAEKYSTLLL
jgi:hypothetical protein